LRELRELQTDFQNYLLQQNLSIAFDIVDTTTVPVMTRLNIYRDAYYLRLIEVLQQDYPVLQALLGEEQFEQACRNYIDQHPSQYKSVRWFGIKFSDFLQDDAKAPYLVEAAKFEWLLTESFDAADASSVTVEIMQTIPFNQWPEMRFKLHPSFRTLMLDWNVVSIWKSFKEGKKMISPQRLKQPASWIIWRKNHDTQFCSMPASEMFMLHAMANGASFAEICEGLYEWIDEQQIATQTAILLKKYILDNLISEII
jgi:hypothetical protein